jgi:hypothetical protein
MSNVVSHRLKRAAAALGTVDPLDYVGGIVHRTFERPWGDTSYGFNTLTPGAAPLEPSFSQREPRALRFVMEPLGPGHSAAARREEATRETRHLVGTNLGRDALRWFDRASEEFRMTPGASGLDYGAWFGSSFDNGGLSAAKVYYELRPHNLTGLSDPMSRLAAAVARHLPGLRPGFLSITCRRDTGAERLTFLPSVVLRVKDLDPLLTELGLAHQLPGIMQAVGVALGGRFELPPGSCLVGVGDTVEGPELKLEIALGMVPDLPRNFLDLIILRLQERPSHLQALARWMQAFTPEDAEWPGNFSVLSIRTTARSAPTLSLYLRPVELEVGRLFAPEPDGITIGAAPAPVPSPAA